MRNDVDDNHRTKVWCGKRTIEQCQVVLTLIAHLDFPPHFPFKRYHVLGPTFTWMAFFKDMDTDDDGQFDVNEFITAIAKVYHDELLNEDGSTHVAAGDGDAQGGVAVTLAVDTVSSGVELQAMSRTASTELDDNTRIVWKRNPSVGMSLKSADTTPGVGTDGDGGDQAGTSSVEMNMPMSESV